MKYCSKCGSEIHDEAVICTHCGCSVAQTQGVSSADAPNTGFAVLGFFIPLVGLILYLVNKDTFPKKAHSAGKGALIGVCVSVGLWILYIIFAVALVAAVA